METTTAQLYCKICGGALDSGGPVFHLWCTGCSVQWFGKDAIEQVNIALGELTSWQAYNFYGEFEL